MLQIFRLSACLFFIFTMVCSSISAAQGSSTQAASGFDSEQILKFIGNVSKKYGENTKEPALREVIKELSEYGADANACVTDSQSTVEEFDKSLAALGESAKGDSNDVVQQRKLLKKQKEAAERQLSDCRLIVLQANQTADRLKNILQIQLERELLTLTPPTWRILTLIFPLQSWSFDQDKFVATSGMETLAEWHWWTLAAIIFVALGAALLLRYFLGDGKLKVLFPEATFLDRLFCNLLGHFLRFAFPIFLFGGWSLLVFFVQYQENFFSFLSAVCYGGFVYSVLLWVNQVLLNPISGAPLVKLASADAKRLSKQLAVLISGLFLCSLLFAALLSQSLSAPWLVLVRDLLITIFSGQLFWLVWLMGRISVLSGRVKIVRFAFLLVLSLILFSEWVGYRNLAEYLLFSVIKTIGSIGTFWLLMNLLQDFFEGLAEGEHPWQHRTRDMLGLKANEKQPGVYWFYLMITLILWFGLLLWLLRVWGLSEASFSTLYLYMMGGVRLADYTIVPMHIGSGVLVFFLLFFVFHLVRDRFVKKWLIRTRVERGSREAIVSITGYLGFTLAFLIGLSVAGVNFSSLALIAGALSVGIGFGLQNVVNNFISGIILLFERPIKTGDWVRVGQTEGYVRKISIRTTQIQTFDRADVIVPNSDLISFQVTNRMLRDHYGRVLVKLRAAYGTDVQLMKKLLLDIANKHPSVIKNELVAPAPQVYFLAFGESALEFELRAVIYDVDAQLDTVSDLHFAIEEAFRLQNIQIPYPQRDVHIRNLDEVKKKLEG